MVTPRRSHRRARRTHSGVLIAMRERFTIARHNDEGMTLIEVIFAITIFTILLTTFAVMLINAQTVLRASEDNQAVTAVSAKLIEQIRSLPYTTVQSGIPIAEAMADLRVSSTGGIYTYNGERLLTSPTVPAGTPFSPHIRVGGADLMMNGRTFTVAVYPTKCYMAKNNPTVCAPSQTAPDDSQMIRITTIVSWTGGPTKGSQTFNTLLFSPTDCMQNSTRSYAGACEPFFHALAQSNGPAFTLTPTTSWVSPARPGITEATLGFSGLSVSTTQEQVAVVTADSFTTGGTISTSPTNEIADGGTGYTIQSSTDPMLKSQANASASWSQTPTGNAKSASMNGKNSIISVPGNDVGREFTALAATTADNCADILGRVPNAYTPCGYATSNTPGGRLSIDFGPDNAADFITVAPAAGVSRTWVARFPATQGGVWCPGTVDNGCTVAQSTRSVGATAVGALPPTLANSISPRYTTLFSVPGYTDTVTAASGSGAPAAVAPVITGSRVLTYWDNATKNYKTLDLSTVAPNTPLHITAQGTAIELEADLLLNPQSVLPVDTGNPAGCAASACYTRVVRQGPFTGTVQVTAFSGGTAWADYIVSVDLGSNTAQTIYQAVV